MRQKIGAGNEPQNYDEKNGRYAKESGDKSKEDLKIFLPSEEKYIDVTPHERKKIREQIDTGYKGKIEDKDLPEFNKKALEYIKVETGYSTKEAEIFQNALIEYFGGDYESFTSGQRKEQQIIIDEGLKRMPSYDGEIYRGMHFSNEDKRYETFANNEKGDIIKMKSISSWSSTKGVARRYAADNNKYEDSVLFVCDENKNGVACQNLSKWNTYEAEVLCPSFSSWQVAEKQIINKYDYLKPIYLDLITSADKAFKKKIFEDELKDLEENKARFMAAKVCILYVKEN